MVDASRLDLEGNIAATRRIVEIAHPKGVCVEGELGAVLGHESGPMPPYDELFESGKTFTVVEEAKRFVKETECDWLSVAIGNIHGAVSDALRDQKKPEARLNLEHLDKLSQATRIPLVLHGGSGGDSGLRAGRDQEGYREGQRGDGDPASVRARGEGDGGGVGWPKGGVRADG